MDVTHSRLASVVLIEHCVGWNTCYSAGLQVVLACWSTPGSTWPRSNIDRLLAGLSGLLRSLPAWQPLPRPGSSAWPKRVRLQPSLAGSRGWQQVSNLLRLVRVGWSSDVHEAITDTCSGHSDALWLCAEQHITPGLRLMATVTEASTFPGLFNKPGLGHAAVPASENLLAEQAEQQSREPSSSTDISNRTENLQGAVHCTKPALAHESHEEPEEPVTREGSSIDGEAGTAPVSDVSDADALAPAPTAELAMPDEVVEDGSVEAPSDESEEELDELNGTSSHARGKRLPLPLLQLGPAVLLGAAKVPELRLPTGADALLEVDRLTAHLQIGVPGR